jgi:hypothetical protein
MPDVRRYKREELTECAQGARGGYIITTEGELLAVDDCDHHGTFRHAFNADEHEVLKLGAIRVSFAGGRLSFEANWYRDAVTIVALQTLRIVLEHHEDRHRYFMEEHVVDEAGLYDYDNHLAHHPEGFNAARSVIAKAISRRMAAQQSAKAA